ncbi:MAG: response regulator transcription factor [Anaerolineae bacterium]|nr:response regulator transcription factor [Anaerolineae bacterium]
MTGSNPIRLLIVDDHPVVRRGLRALISSEPDMAVADEAVDGLEAIAKARSLQPDVILLDLVMPRMSGLEAIPGIKQAYPEARILILTSFAEDDKVFPAIKAGALGYLLKDSSPDDLLAAIRDVYQGRSSLHPTIARKLINELNQPSDLPPTPDPLTGREVDILKLVARGLTNQEIAAELVLSEWTVRTHVRNILDKLHLANRTQAALYALREGLANLDGP